MTAILIVAAVSAVVFISGVKTKSVPIIDAITPPVGSPGEVVVISGKNFGESREMNYVEFAGARLTASSYISWSDNEIKFVLPANIQDGLVYVGTKSEKSNPVLFANETEIPVPVTGSAPTTLPKITSLSADRLAPGEILTVYGSNFGENRNTSQVLFTADYGEKSANSDFTDIKLYNENMIPASDFDFAYEYWSSTEIRVRVPDGAVSGEVIVDTGKEKSEPKNFSVDTRAGKKKFSERKIYLIKYTADIADVVITDFGTVTLRCPVPVKYSAQTDVEVTEVSPEPILFNYQNNLIHQFTKNRSGPEKNVSSQSFALPVYEVNTTVYSERIGSYSDISAGTVSAYTKADALVPSDNQKIKELAEKITGKEKNPFRKAKLLYAYITAEFEILRDKRNESASPLDLIEEGKGDAYDFAVILTALMRAAGIPAITDGGILINQDLTTQPHWWCEFYIPKVGWIPADPALGAGLEYKNWQEISNPGEFYFGNLDSHHIAFSRSWSNLKPFSQDNKIVQYPRSFALQSIWEESSDSTAKYSSFWTVPVVAGVY